MGDHGPGRHLAAKQAPQVKSLHNMSRPTHQQQPKAKVTPRATHLSSPAGGLEVEVLAAALGYVVRGARGGEHEGGAAQEGQPGRETQRYQLLVWCGGGGDREGGERKKEAARVEIGMPIRPGGEKTDYEREREASTGGQDGCRKRASLSQELLLRTRRFWGIPLTLIVNGPWPWRAASAAVEAVRLRARLWSCWGLKNMWQTHNTPSD